MDNRTDSTPLIQLNETKIVTKALVNNFSPTSQAVNKEDGLITDASTSSIVFKEPQKEVHPIKSTGAIKKKYTEKLEEKFRQNNYEKSWRESWMQDLRSKLEKEDENITLVKSEVKSEDDTPDEGSLQELIKIPHLFLQQKTGSNFVTENIEMKNFPLRNELLEVNDVNEESDLPQQTENTIDYLSRESLIASGFVLFINTSFIGFVVYFIIAYFQYTSN